MQASLTLGMSSSRRRTFSKALLLLAIAAASTFTSAALAQSDGPAISVATQLQVFGRSAAFSPDGKRVVFGGSAILRLWDVDTGILMREFFGNRQTANAVAFSPDGRFVAAGTAFADNTVRIWDV